MLLGFKVLLIAAGVVSGQFPLESLPDGVPVPVSQVREVAPDGGAWQVEREWDAAAEEEFAQFVEAIGTARERKVFRLAEGLRNPEINPLWEPEDVDLRFEADCATFAYALRTYFAYKSRRPFSFTANKGRRYRYGNRPLRFGDHTSFSDFRSLFRSTLSAVSSGHFRMDALLEGTDTYPIEITPDSIRPGVTYYDPGGHVLVVYRVDAVTGDIYMMDGHPDGTVTLKTFGHRMPRGSRRTGGGFRAWRHFHVLPLEPEGNAVLISRELNRDAAHYSANDQYQDRYELQGEKVSYHDWVKHTVAHGSDTVSPLAGLEARLERICDQLTERVVLVESARIDGWPDRDVEGRTPRKVYWGSSEWHEAATAVLDTELRANVAELRDYLRRLLDWKMNGSARLAFDGDGLALEAALIAEFERVSLRPECSPLYVNSDGEEVRLALREVLPRVNDLSFDPYHCPEQRWGAPDGSAEAASCTPDDDREKRYRAQASLRTRIRMNARPPAAPLQRLSDAALRRTRALFGI
jgi:hypothetical protein